MGFIERGPPPLKSPAKKPAGYGALSAAPLRQRSAQTHRPHRVRAGRGLRLALHHVDVLVGQHRTVKKSIQVNSQIKTALLTVTAANPTPSRATKTLDLHHQNRGSTQGRQPQRKVKTISALPSARWSAKCAGRCFGFFDSTGRFCNEALKSNRLRSIKLLIY